jgi:hypothetical protein
MAAVLDDRRRPRIPSDRVVRSLLLMLTVRVGSLNGLEQGRPGGRWARWLGGALPSADTLGRVAASVPPADIRALLRGHYRARKRRKSLLALPGRLQPLILDGHEFGASYRRHCPGCLRRTVATARGPQRTWRPGPIHPTTRQSPLSAGHCGIAAWARRVLTSLARYGYTY